MGRKIKDPEITLHTPAEFEMMARAGRLAAAVLDFIAPKVLPGVTTQHLNDLCHDFIIKHGATPACLGYRGFPRSICTSVNHVVCHGIPGPYILREGDIINLDVTVILDGWYGDTSRMFAVGSVSRQASTLMRVAHEAMMRGIRAVHPGATLGDVGHAIQRYVENLGFSIVEDFCGHGIGRIFHDQPQVLHKGRPKQGLVLKPGMFFTIEPMINVGEPYVAVETDGWTVVTQDRSLSAQYEHTLGVTPTGYTLFTEAP